MLLPLVLALTLLTDSGSEWVTDPVQAPGISHVIMHSETLGEEVSFHVYLPDAYHKSPDSDFPVLYWLHGGSEQTTAGISFMAGHFTAMIADGEAPPMIVVFPHGRPFGMWVDSKDGRSPVESILMEDIIPWVDEHYRTIAEAGGRLIEGWSMGGYGAARLGLRYHDRFAGFSMGGAGPVRLDFLEDATLLVPLERRKMIFEEIFGNDTTYYVTQNPWHIAGEMAGILPEGWPVRIAVGTDDPMLADNRAFSEHIAGLGIAHSYLEIPGVAHEPVRVRQFLAENDPGFYTRVFQAVLTSSESGLERSPDQGPEGFRLLPNYPNPFNPQTILTYELGWTTGVRIDVHDAAGRRIRRLYDGVRPAGRHEIVFNAQNLSSGVYLYRIYTDTVTMNGRMLLVR